MRGLFLLLLMLGLACPCQAARVSKDLMGKYSQMVQQIMQADSEMVVQLDVTAKKLEQFYAVRGHLPRTREERELFQKVLAKYILGNPFHPQVSCLAGTPTVETTLDSDKQKSKPPYSVPIFWLENHDLSRENFGRLAQCPDDSWRMLPGTILILTNADNTYLICAMAEDGSPMKDRKLPGEPPHVICKEVISVNNGKPVTQAIRPIIAGKPSVTQ